MNDRDLYVSDYDRQRLQNLLDEAMADPARSRQLQDFKALAQELARCKSIAPQEVPSDLVTMNSRVRVTDLENGESDEYTLVFPERANAERGKISVLAPIGMALLGYRVDSTLAWKVPGGTRQLRIDAILYQPEAAGDFQS